MKKFHLLASVVAFACAALTAPTAQPLLAAPPLATSSFPTDAPLVSPLPATSLAPAASVRAGARYAAIAETFFADGFRESPSGATATGVHRYDARLDDVSAAAYRRHFAREHRTLLALRALDPAGLSPEVAIDRAMLVNAILDDELDLGERAQWRHDPDLYVGMASGSLYSLIERRFAPAATRLRDAIAREQALPHMLAQARHNLGSVDAATKTVSALDADGAVSFIENDVPAAFAGTGDSQARAAFRESTARASAAMRAFAAYVRGIVPSGTYAIGASAYERRLRYEDALAMPVAAYLAVGERALRRDRARFVATARAINPDESPEAVYASLARKHPAPGKLLAAAHVDLTDLRRFVERKRIVTLPADADITVVATPKFERSFVTAQEDPPGPLERVATKAYYNVTPADAAWPRARQVGYLAQFNDYERPLISGHEVYPGHFVNYTIDKHLDLSLTRRLLWNSEFGEGWAHYGEQMMVDQGWGDGDPHVRLAQLSEALLRECRFVVGVQLHTGGWSLARSERFFRTACFQTPAVATEETLRGTQDPMYGYYTLGKLMILKLRSDYERKLGSAYTLQKFHDALLAHGDPPVPLLRPLLLGSDDDGKAL